MPKRKRLRRPEPVRTAPIRKFSTLLRTEGETPAASGFRPPHDDDAAAQAVRMGYSVLEEQLRKGRVAAQQVTGGGGAGIGMPAGEPGPIMNRLLRYSTDLLGLYFDFAGMLAQPSMLDRMGVGKPASAEAGERAHEGSARGTRLVIEITTKRNSQLTVELWGNAAGAKLAVPALQSLDAEKPPIKGITFAPAVNGEPARLRIAIPEAVAADLYTGLIVNAESKEYTGTLSVRLFD